MAQPSSASARTHDAVLFGATGFTGRYVLREVLGSYPQGLRLAVAGRSGDRLRALVQELGAEGRVQIIAGVDVSDADSLARMCASTRLVMSVVGPYRLYGEPVVAAAVAAGTDYLDVSGEPEFMERMEAKYGAAAAAAGCYVASAAGFDSVPGDLGTVLAQRQFAPPSVPSTVEAFLSLSTGPEGYSAHFATWESAVLGIASVRELRSLRAAQRSGGKAAGAAGAVDGVGDRKEANKVAAPAGPRPPVPKGAEFVRHPSVNTYSVPFPGADAAVVRRTQRALAARGQPPVHFTVRFQMQRLTTCYLAGAVGASMSALAGHAWGRALLLKFPRVFSAGAVTREGPSPEQAAAAGHAVTLVARGYKDADSAGPGSPPDREVVLRISGPDPGYAATSIYLAQAALTVLEDRGKLPGPGVHTPGALLCDTGYAERLQARGIKIEVVSDGAVEGPIV
uniref:Saccharopine dehydrogenase NADP binding domain-containing protein n=1 Tax=Chlamydomonas euryale TaxID=1486919 RepID=A0A7R9YR15_9CHLO|mmetsp:Transcript_13575/g.39307  ORF Transcript_13575/g.39307 Transcript_13575/m.39307 type:complete len:452 (+) Transcript_13575:359-1714(+)